jgi:hypothetical protein
MLLMPVANRHGNPADNSDRYGCSIPAVVDRKMIKNTLSQLEKKTMFKREVLRPSERKKELCDLLHISILDVGKATKDGQKGTANRVDVD